MRTTLIAASLFALAIGCSNSGAHPGGDDTTPGDDGTGDDGSGSDPGAPARGFQLISPDVKINAGQEITYCWYFQTPNTEDLVIKKWSSTMSTGSHHLILYTTSSNQKTPGTIDSDECGGFDAQAGIPNWTYAAQTATAEVELPQDDGTGKPLGQDIKAGTSGYIQMHYLNTSDHDLMAHVTVNAEAYDAGTAYTKTAPYITYSTDIHIPAGAVNYAAPAKNSPIAAGKKFWQMSTHAHKQAVETKVTDGSSMVFDSTNWEHPGVKEWDGSPFYSFSAAGANGGNTLTWQCTYSNIGDNAAHQVNEGASAATNEMCMATGYYFPATGPITCIAGTGPSAFCLGG